MTDQRVPTQSFYDHWETTKAALSKPMPDVAALAETLRSICTHKYIPGGIKGLTSFFNKHADIATPFFANTLPKLAQLALQFPTLFPDKIKLLPSQTNDSVTFTQQQVASILSLAFFCVWPSQPDTYNAINFIPLYLSLDQPQEAAKMLAIIHYFNVVTARDVETLKFNKITFERQAIALDKFPDYANSTKPLKKMKVMIEGSIEDDYNNLQVDFANMFIGGGVLQGGCVQEEIRFALNTELIASCLITECLGDNEVLFMTGSEQFSKYTGYAFKLQWAGPNVDTTPRDDTGHLITRIVGMDATDYRSFGSSMQYNPKIFTRETNKAYSGFFVPPTHPNHAKLIASPVATGNWGCGAFLGDKQHKSVLQLLAASAADRDVIYYVFDDKNLAAGLTQVCQLLESKNVTVGALWAAFCAYGSLKPNERPSMPFFSFLNAHFK